MIRSLKTIPAKSMFLPKNIFSKYILTAFHVIEKAKQVEVEYFDKSKEVVEIIFSDKETDIAILKSKAKKKP